VKDATATLEAAVRQSVQAAAREMQESLIKEAVLQFERDLRKAVGSVAVNVANYFTVERMQNQLVIRVQIESNSKPA
jgi:hypothetical protein